MEAPQAELHVGSSGKICCHFVDRKIPQIEHALHIARPQRARKRTQEGALVYEVERPVEIEFKEILETNQVRDRSQGPLRAFHPAGAKSIASVSSPASAKARTS